MSAPTRPAVAAELLAEVTEAAPSRLLRKLDKKPDLAQGWQWSLEDKQWNVTTDRGETVTLTAEQGVIRSREQATCTCLLAPRCLHLLAVLSALDVDDGLGEGPPAAPPEQQSESAKNISPNSPFTFPVHQSGTAPKIILNSPFTFPVHQSGTAPKIILNSPFTFPVHQSKTEPLSTAQIDVAHRALALSAELLAAGALAVGPALQAELL